MLTETQYFYPALVAYCLCYYFAAGLAVNIAYHRCLTHRSFDLWLPLKYLFVTLGLPAGTPIQWIGNHRFHHQHADHPNDPHSPVQRGFWHAHVGWYIGTDNPFICFLYSIAGPLRTIFDGWNRPRSNLHYNHLAADLSSDVYFDFISKPLPFMLACWLHTALFFSIAFLLWGWIGFALLWTTLVGIYNLGEAIDSIAHLYGSRPYSADHFARNNRLLGVFTLGEGWHANHHVFPDSAKHGLLPGQFDMAWLMIRLLETFGLARNPMVPSNETIALKVKSGELA
jgi:fatty-acid desaturase